MHKAQQIIEITSLGGLGDGIGTLNGKPVFVPKSCAGDKLEVELIRENQDGLHAVIKNIISGGPDRAEAPCPYFSGCGGCKLQHLSADAYKNFKTRMLHSAIAYAGFDFPDAKIIFIGAGSRRRVDFQARMQHGQMQLGFYASRSNDLVPITHCLVLEPVLQAMIAPLSEMLSNLPFAGDIKMVSLTAADKGMDLVIEVRSHMPVWQPKCDGIDRISIRHGEHIKTLYETSPVQMLLGGYEVALPPDAFLQATRESQQILTDAVLHGVAGAKSVVDLFCGIGTYSFPLSRNANVHAVEGDAKMVSTIKSSIKQHGIKTLSTQSRDLFKNPLSAEELAKFDTAVINPPRAGAKAQTLGLADSKIGTIVMVSCNPATFSRDAKILKNAGFRLTHVMGVDQFVYSPYLEIVAVFAR